MNARWIVVAAATAATLTNGCMAFREMSGQGRESSGACCGSSVSDDSAIADTRQTSDDEAAGRSTVAAGDAADASDRAAAAADRAAAVAARASAEATKTETGFQKSMRK